jgi:uncharacterized membrane protein
MVMNDLQFHETFADIATDVMTVIVSVAVAVPFLLLVTIGIVGIIMTIVGGY